MAERDGTVIGTAMCWPYGTGAATLGMIIVSPDCQGAGIGKRYLLLTEDSHIGLTYRTQAFSDAPYNSFTVLRANWDQWFAGKAEEAGAFIIPEMLVREMAREFAASPVLT